MTTILQARPRQFVSTPSIDRVATRALRYLQSGYSVHLQGPAGTGKTTLALHLADLLSRPIMLLFGDDEFKTSDLIGNQSGFTRKKVFDNFIHSVVKMEDEVRQNWVDSRLTLACREGFTLVYDEFNRSRPEVNNVLLSALEEKLLVLPPNSSRSEYIRVNPHFRAIFTSNPAEYCGVHATQDALLDRLITINMPEPDELTQHEILVQKTEIDRESAALIVQLVKMFRHQTLATDSSGLRSCLMIAKICKEHNIDVFPENGNFRELCQDILLARSSKSLAESTQILWDVFNTYQNCDVVPQNIPDDHIEPGSQDSIALDILNASSREEPEQEHSHSETSYSAVPSSLEAQPNYHIADDSDFEHIAPLAASDHVGDHKQPISVSGETLDAIFGEEEVSDSDDVAIAPDVIREAVNQVETLSPDPNELEIPAENSAVLDAERRVDYGTAADKSSDPLVSENTTLEDSVHEEPESGAYDSVEFKPTSLDSKIMNKDEAIAHGGISSVTLAPGDDVSGFDAVDMDLALTLEATDINHGSLDSAQSVATQDDAVSATQPENPKISGVKGCNEEVLENRHNSSEPGVPFEHEVYKYLQQSHDARPSQIESALGISRFQTVNALRSLTDKGLIAFPQNHANDYSNGNHQINRHLRGHILPPKTSGMMLQSNGSGGNTQ